MKLLKIKYPRNQKEFRSVVVHLMGTNADLYFGTMQDVYIAEYKPKYPQRSNADFIIIYDWVTAEFKIYGNLYSLIPTIIRFENLQEFIRYFRTKNTEV